MLGYTMPRRKEQPSRFDSEFLRCLAPADLIWNHAKYTTATSRFGVHLGLELPICFEFVLCWVSVANVRKPRFLPNHMHKSNTKRAQIKCRKPPSFRI